MNEQRALANNRERKRTQKLNQAYKRLQSIIPKEPSDKMSKIHTLRLALAYIEFLNQILDKNDINHNVSFDCPTVNISPNSPSTSTSSMDSFCYYQQLHNTSNIEKSSIGFRRAFREYRFCKKK